MVGWLVGWLVGCKNRANYLHSRNYLPYLRTFPFQILHTYLTAIRGNCKGVKFLEGLGGFLGAAKRCFMHKLPLLYSTDRYTPVIDSKNLYYNWIWHR